MVSGAGRDNTAATAVTTAVTTATATGGRDGYLSGAAARADSYAVSGNDFADATAAGVFQLIDLRLQVRIFRVQDSIFRVQGSIFRVQGSIFFAQLLDQRHQVIAAVIDNNA